MIRHGATSSTNKNHPRILSLWREKERQFELPFDWFWIYFPPIQREERKQYSCIWKPASLEHRLMGLRSFHGSEIFVQRSYISVEYHFHFIPEALSTPQNILRCVCVCVNDTHELRNEEEDDVCPLGIDFSTFPAGD